MRSSVTNTLFLLSLSLFYVAVFAAPGKHAPLLVVRQTSIPNDPQCLDYSRTANLSTIGANSTYRTAFLQASSVGTHSNGRMLNAAIAKLPSLTQDQALNEACGNLTQIALTEAARNFTRGIVAQFDGIEGNPGLIKAGPEVMPLVGAISLTFLLVFKFA